MGIATKFFPYSTEQREQQGMRRYEDNGMSYSNEMRHDESSPIAINSFVR